MAQSLFTRFFAYLSYPVIEYGSAYGSTITDCYNNGDINAEKYYAGGIAGDIRYESTVTNCYNTGNITSSNNSAGGIGGGVSGSTVTNSAAINEKINAASGAGRIAGNIWGGASISNNFALETMQVTGFGYTDEMHNGADKSESDFNDQSTYEYGLDWNFGGGDTDPLWKMPNDGSYPILYWQ